MSRLLRLPTTAFACLALAAAASASDLRLDGQTSIVSPLGYTIAIELDGAPNTPAVVVVDFSPGPVTVFGELLPIGLTPFLTVVDVGSTDGGGNFDTSLTIPNVSLLDGFTLYFIGAVKDVGEPSGFDFSNGADSLMLELTDFTETQLAGRSRPGYPFFEFTRAVNQGSNLEVTVDPSIHKLIAGKTADVYVTAAQTASEWDASPMLVDVSGDGADTVTFTGPTLVENSLVVDAGTLTGGSGPDIGVGYDVVIDLNQNGTLDDGDFIDGYDDEAGFYIVHDLTQPGPYAVTERVYSGGTFLGQDLFYPSNIASLGQLPLIVVSHGNGHNYLWYDHLGNHLASYGFVVMSHQNNTVPGIETASTTTLTNTDFILGNLDIIAEGDLDGHVQIHNIGWIGHSRGGEGVARAYDRLIDGTYVPANFTAADIRFISSIAPTDFLGNNTADPHGVDYHLWVGGADADVSGCVSSDITQSFHLLDRAEQQKQSISLHGVGHGDFHNGGGSSVASGPCLIGRPTTHTIMRGYALPLFKHYLEGNIPSKDFLWRQWEEFRPIGAPVGACVNVDLQYREGESSGKLVIDDFQTNPSTAVSSSGEAVTFDVLGMAEDRFDDPNGNFTWSAPEVMNGYSQCSAADTGRGITFGWEGVPEAHLTFDVPAAGWDMTAYAYLSFRAAQSPRHPSTGAVLGDLTFDVELSDGSGGTSTIPISAWGGGIEEPYQRTSCGTGVGWGAEFETVRIRLTDFLNAGSGLDLTDVRSVTLLFGSSHGANTGRLGFDDLELTTD